MKNGIYLAYVCALLNALIVGLSFLFTVKALGPSNPMDVLASRFSVGFLGFALLASLKLVKVRLNLKSLYKLWPLTVFYPAFFFFFQAYGLKTVPSSEAGILFAVIPILTAVLASLFLKERTTLLQKASILLSVSGVIFIFFMKGSTVSLANWSGLGFLLISCLSIAAYSVMARNLLKSFKPLEVTYFMLGVGFIFFNAIAVINHLRNGDLEAMFTPWGNAGFAAAILFLGILASFITSLLSNFVLSKIPASQMSVFSNLSTVISIIAGAAFLNEKVYYYHIIGSTLIILGVIGTNLFKDKPADAGSSGKAS
ncbi:DMT family transporter [Peribacillus sp. SCS-26]|uniref:DMT family transporter n=1 Tax=Paraperibacillus marinus TaxID=3115295 RepID=UPI003905EB23